MAVQPTYPGVYIDEFTPGAPIQGVGTNVAAFVGIAERGEMDVPTKVTSWDRFVALYGASPVPGFFLWHAVRGFFQNGGTICYVVRASNGVYGELTVQTRKGSKDLFTIRAREPGAIVINVAVAARTVLDKTKTSLFQATGALTAAAALGDREVVMSAVQAAKFRPGDTVTIDAAGEHLRIARISSDGTNGTLGFDQAVANAYAVGKTVRLDDTKKGARTFRITSTVAVPDKALVPGTLLTFDDGTSHDSEFVESVQTEVLAAGTVTYRVVLRQGLSFPVDMTKTVKVQSEEFDLTVKQGATTTVYDGLSMDAAHPKYFVRAVNGDVDGLVTILPIEPPPAVAVPDSLPIATPSTALAGGKAEDLTTLVDQDFLDALDALREIDDVNLIAVPDCTVIPSPGSPAAIQQAVIAHCEQLADRFAVLDALPGIEPFGSAGVENQRLGLDSTRGYAALYYPWLRAPAVGAGAPVLVPPSGHVCGVIARSDGLRGVHKAPANEIVNGVLDVERTMSDVDQGILNLQGINVIRRFHAGGRPMVWGARTTATDTNWQYVNIRRLFLFLEESIQEGIRWAVFEPNNNSLWEKLRRSITDFLTRVWRDGGLFGETADKAFYVRIDEVLNPDSERALGRLHIEIGVRPSYPAEFIIVHIGIWYGGSDVAES